MSSRRIQKVASLIHAVVGEVVTSRLSDPRIMGMVTVTRVEVTSDLKQAIVYLTILCDSESKKQISLRAIQHAHGFIQGHLAEAMSSKTCPTLRFELDRDFAKRMELMQLLNQVEQEREQQEHGRELGADGDPAGTAEEVPSTTESEDRSGNNQ